MINLTKKDRSKILIDEDGNKYYHNKNGDYHRIDGPACEYSDGDGEWFKNGELHRLDGPAVDYISGYKEYWIEGIKYSEEEFNQKIQKMKE